MSVVYDQINQSSIFFHQGNIFQGTLDLFQDELDKSDVWYLVDGHHPRNCEAKTILATSPQKRTIETFRSGLEQENILCQCGLGMKYLHVFIKMFMMIQWRTWMLLLKFYVPKLTMKKLKNCLECGEVYHELFCTKTVNVINQEMEGAIRICDLDMIVKIIRDVVDPRLEVNNKTVHIYTNVPDEEQDNVDNNTMDVCKELDDSLFPSYSQQLVLFASTYISEKVINCYEEEKRDQMYSFLLASKDQMGYETLQGKIFEKFPRLENKTFQSIDNINTHNEYYQPQQKNFSSVDSLVLPNMLFQMTINQHHGIKVKGLDDLKNILDITKEIKFYFVMPPGCFDGMKKQPFHARKGED
ncbi:14824_t:CDS:2 [Entrophospora sp. SA101]|nr:14824_t:CDS:2 [Entrophospora sp. SA101]CAJ0851474.1 7347_t:CDS:2 [Entrophospora sp. SA101]